jgi:hypothetical protein
MSSIEGELPTGHGLGVSSTVVSVENLRNLPDFNMSQLLKRIK